MIFMHLLHDDPEIRLKMILPPETDLKKLSEKQLRDLFIRHGLLKLECR